MTNGSHCFFILQSVIIGVFFYKGSHCCFFTKCSHCLFFYKVFSLSLFFIKYSHWGFFTKCSHCFFLTVFSFYFFLIQSVLIVLERGRRGRDRMVVGFTTTFMQSVPITTEVVSSNPFHGEMYSIQHYVIKLISDLWQVVGFLRFPPPIKLTSTIKLKYCWKWHYKPYKIAMP